MLTLPQSALDCGLLGLNMVAGCMTSVPPRLPTPTTEQRRLGILSRSPRPVGRHSVLREDRDDGLRRAPRTGYELAQRDETSAHREDVGHGHRTIAGRGARPAFQRLGAMTGMLVEDLECITLGHHL